MGFWRAALAACTVATGMAGCGGDDGSAERAETPPAAQTETQAAERERGDEATATQAQSGRLRLAAVGRFQSPTTLTAPPNDRRRVFVTEQAGRIRVVRGGRVLRRPFLDISRQITAGGEQGLLGLAFAPDYQRSRRFYVNYTNRSGDTRIVEYRRSRRNPNRALPGSARVLIAQDQPESNHNGGQLAFGPDRMLYIALGDGGGGNDEHGRIGNAQSLGTLLGKILRIDPRPGDGRPYRIPSSNPFVDRAGARGEIYSYGLRNPWRFSFDRANGALAIADVGQDAVEEVSYVRRNRGNGANFGWRVWEGTRRVYDGEEASGHVRPVMQKRHDDGYCSITGGYVVRDRNVPRLRGRYVYSDFCRGEVRSVRLSPSGARGDRRVAVPRVGSVSSFGEDARGRVYVLSLNGPVYRITQG